MKAARLRKQSAERLEKMKVEYEAQSATRKADYEKLFRALNAKDEELNAKDEELARLRKQSAECSQRLMDE